MPRMSQTSSVIMIYLEVFTEAAEDHFVAVQADALQRLRVIISTVINQLSFSEMAVRRMKGE